VEAGDAALHVADHVEEHSAEPDHVIAGEALAD